VSQPNVPTDLKLPHGSIWPVFLALGMAFFTMGLVVNWMLPFGGLLLLAAAIGWFREDHFFFRDGISTGERNGWHGTILFLCTEVMLFGGLFAAYFAARSKAEVWPPAGTPDLPVIATGINTLVLLLSGVTMHYAHAALRKGNKRNFHIGLVATVFLGGIFMFGLGPLANVLPAIFHIGQLPEYRELISHGMTLSSAPFGSSFYMLTGTHGLHVLAGLVFIVIVLVRSLIGDFTPERHIAVEAAAIYWHFVDVVWVVLYAIIYLGIG